VSTSGTLSYNLNDYSSNLFLFPAHLWFDLIYDLSIPGHQGGVNGFSFTVTSNAAATPTTWSLSTNYLSTLTTPTASSSIISTITTSKSFPASVTSPPPVSPNGGSSLTTGAKSGIGIAAAAVTLTLLLGMAWFIISKRRTRKLEDRLAYSTATAELKPELQGHSIAVNIEAQDAYNEVHGSDVPELGV
jgi:hypothetical protein